MARRTDSRRVKTPNGAGSVIFNKTTKRWMGRYTVQDPEGKSLRPTVYGATEQECRAKLVEALAAKHDGTLIVSRGRAKTVGDVYAAWLADLDDRVAEGTRSPRTVIRYREIGDQYIIPVIGKRPVKTLQPADVELVMRAVGRRGRSSRTINYARASVRAVLSFAKRKGWVNRNVAEMTEARDENRRREVKPLPLDQLARVLADALEDCDGRLYVVSVALGTRQSETLGLTWDQHVDDLDADEPQVHIRRSLQWDETRRCFFVREITKTKKSRRDLNLPEIAIEALKRQKRYQREARLAAGPNWSIEFGDLVFSDFNGEPLKRDRVSKRWAARLRDLKITHTGFHGGTRHGAASLLHAQGVEMLDISRTLGHSQLATTSDIYTEIFSESRKTVASAMDRALSGK